MIGGRLSVREEENPKIILDFIESAEQIQANNNKRVGLFVRFTDNKAQEFIKCSEFLNKNAIDGDTMLYYYFNDSKKYFPCKKISVNEYLIRDLKLIVGDKNVILQK